MLNWATKISIKNKKKINNENSQMLYISILIKKFINQYYNNFFL